MYKNSEKEGKWKRGHNSKSSLTFIMVNWHFFIAMFRYPLLKDTNISNWLAHLKIISLLAKNIRSIKEWGAGIVFYTLLGYVDLFSFTE